MRKTIPITVSICPVSARDTSGGTVRVRIPLEDADTGALRTEDDLRSAAVARACERLYGRNTSWWADNGLPGYGQVMRPCKTGGSSAVTYRARLDVEIPELPASHVAALAQQAADWQAYEQQLESDYRAGHAAYDPEKRPPSDASYEFKKGWKDAANDARFMEELR